MNKDFFQSKSSNIGAFTGFLRSVRNKAYLDYLEKNIPIDILNRTIPEKIYYFLSETKPSIYCSCGSDLKFIGFKNGYRKTCGRTECVVSAREKTNLKNLGVTNPMKSLVVLDKVKKTLDENWGGESPMKHEQVKQKWRKSVLNNLGTTSPQANPEVRKKSLDTWRKNNERENIIKARADKFRSKSDEEKKQIDQKKKKTIESKFGSYQDFIEYRQQKIRQRSLQKWNLDHHFKSIEISEKRIESYKQIKLEKLRSILPDHLELVEVRSNKNFTDTYIFLDCSNCSERFQITRQLLYLKTEKNINPCPVCNPDQHGISRLEKELLDHIKSIYDGTILHRHKIEAKEIDIFLPDLNIGFEFNGLWWHCELFKNLDFHREKTSICQSKRIDLIHIWEDDWIWKNDIVKSIIAYRLGLISNKLFARNCTIKELNVDQVSEFLVENSIFGFQDFTIAIGLFHGSELVSMMCLNSDKNNYQIVSYCTKKWLTICGGFSKLLKFFKMNNDFSSIHVINDLSLFSGAIFRSFEFIAELVEPQWYHIDAGKRVLVSPSKTLLKISDCGSEKWVLTK